MFKTITEGSAKLNVPVNETISRKLEVFYNPVMKFNRDTTVLFLESLSQKDLLIADIMAASGVRSIRLLKELKSSTVKTIIINDLDAKAVEHARKNLELNNLEKDKRIIIENRDANKLLHDSRKFDYIDIDPFGSPNPFLDSSMQRIKRGGILGVTATDTGALAGAFKEAGIRKYWAVPLRNDYMHETGLRILIRKVQLSASQYDLAAIPLLSYYKDHYLRAFFIMKNGSGAADDILKQHNYIHFCRKCLQTSVSKKVTSKKESKESAKKCTCKNEMETAGPVWTGSLGDKNIVKKMISICKDDKLIKFLSILEQEYSAKAESKTSGRSPDSIVGFYDMHSITKHHKLKDIPKTSAVFEAIRKLGGKSDSKKDKNIVSPSHISGTAVKTNLNVKDFLKIIKKLK